MLALTPEEARRLRQMADDIVACTQDHAYWLGGARDTSLSILAKTAQWLGDTCGHSPCVRPTGHTGHHLDAQGQSW